MPDAVSVTPDWRAMLIAEVDTNPRGKAGVAERLGVSRAYVSRCLSTGASAFKEVPDDFVARVLGTYHVIVCPATGEKRNRDECRTANEPAPTHNPLAMRLWRECQQCPNKPIKEAP